MTLYCIENRISLELRVTLIQILIKMQNNGKLTEMFLRFLFEKILEKICIFKARKVDKFIPYLTTNTNIYYSKLQSFGFKILILCFASL